MSRQLPSRANFDFLKKQAKELLTELLVQGPMSGLPVPKGSSRVSTAFRRGRR